MNALGLDARNASWAFLLHGFNRVCASHVKGLWRNGSASDSRSEGWEFESLWPHDHGLSVVAALRHELLLSWAHVLQVEIIKARSD